MITPLLPLLPFRRLFRPLALEIFLNIRSLSLIFDSHSSMPVPSRSPCLSSGCSTYSVNTNFFHIPCLFYPPPTTFDLFCQHVSLCVSSGRPHHKFSHLSPSPFLDYHYQIMCVCQSSQQFLNQCILVMHHAVKSLRTSAVYSSFSFSSINHVRYFSRPFLPLIAFFYVHQAGARQSIPSVSISHLLLP